MGQVLLDMVRIDVHEIIVHKWKLQWGQIILDLVSVAGANDEYIVDQLQLGQVISDVVRCGILRGMMVDAGLQWGQGPIRPG